MVLETLGSVLLGLVLSLAAAGLLAHRLPARRTVLGAGPLGALFGAFVTHMALGPGHALATLLGAAIVGAVLISLLLRPSARTLRRAMPS
ncbi:integral membrane protein [Streptomyces sp. AcH 505]|uniref:hypothetical protein n=1 Tax=unclassified Streptomyces TaxID=2593676 RepID=UPI000591ADF1|nr:hypothetical protein [Streptomyces sp. NBC_00370]KIF68102.1 integral membrane protein [Streptomyces sp. AcH 505]